MTSTSAIQPLAGITPIQPVRATPAVAATTADVGGQILQALQSLDDLIPPGTALNAEVLATRTAGQNIQFLLQLHLAQGGSLLLTTQGSTENLPVGSKLLVSALNSTQLAVLLQSLEGEAPTPAALPPLQQLDLRQFPVGTALQLRVLTNTPEADSATPRFQVLAKALDSSLDGRQLRLESARPVPVGSLLTVVIKDSQAVSVLPMAQRLDQLDINRQLQGQAQRQVSMTALLQWVEDTPAVERLPSSVSGALQDLLQQTSAVQNLTTPQGWLKALSHSGLQFEQRLLEGTDDELQRDFKANLLRLVDRLLDLVPDDPTRNTQVAAQAALQNLPEGLRRLLTGAAGNAKQATALDFPLTEREGVSHGSGNAELEELLQLATGVIARLQTHQLASLAQTQVLPDGYFLSTWQTEVPWRDGERLSAVQIRFQEERPPPDNGGEQRESLWKVELAFDLEPLGPLQVRAQLARGSLSSEFWAERQLTATLIDGELQHLRERLVAAGFAVGELLSRQGRPLRRGRTSLEQRWIDDTA